ncbi:DUF423 domain-containing protein [Flavobacterium sp. xlx-214]|uniref:DUF423 domain-containing protein n=1 Tax=unclassified Flavobacterium TaxID=196869 RepID=UPI0013D1B952|nr:MULTISPECIES: DUF423 domain-containing protein [unclassified Flavobacterium]MBA5791388.1 DUF423 domain-containing protein [Flavobacterium sp. xlx-221]QMI83460.1 DUF423 domain-containing protein [Flavobacterium sp. xlx-214]
MNHFITTGAVFGALGIILGAFGAHALKKIFNDEQLKNFETGVKYQMYHALLLVILGFNLHHITNYTNSIYYVLTFGILLFSFSIYGLCISSALNKKLKILGPITPIGGLLLLLAWVLLFLNSIV